MHHLRTALVATLVLASSVAHARKAAHKTVHYRAPVLDEDEDTSDDEDTSEDEDTNDDEKTVAFADDDEEESEDAGLESIDAPVRVHQEATPRMRPWHFSLGPYIWAASVDANVSAGGQNIGASVDPDDLKQNVNFGFMAVSELRFNRFSLQGDLTVGSVGINMAKDAGPVMVGVNGDAGSLMVDGLAGVRVYGTDDSKLAVEARAGIRYNRTAVNIDVGVNGGVVAKPNLVFGGADMLLGTRVFFRPHRRFYMTGAGDFGVAGASNSTWSLSLDGNVRIGQRVLMTGGYRTLTNDGDAMGTSMHGPRVAVQLLF